MEHQAIEITGGDGKTHFVWADSAADAYQQATRWGYRHGGFTSVTLLIPQDSREGCWERAVRIAVGRQSSLPHIIEQYELTRAASAPHYTERDMEDYTQAS